MVVPKATRPGIAEAARTRGNTMSAPNTIAVASLLLQLQVAAAADGPPKLDLAPTCDAAARFSITAGRDKEACLEDERTAESTLAQNWSKYNAVDKTQCTGNVKTGGPASYVELLSCLEIMRDAKQIREGDPLVRSDQPVPSTPRRRK
jgi:hypothetical protein